MHQYFHCSSHYESLKTHKNSNNRKKDFFFLVRCAQQQQIGEKSDKFTDFIKEADCPSMKKQIVREFLISVVKLYKSLTFMIQNVSNIQAMRQSLFSVETVYVLC